MTRNDPDVTQLIQYYRRLNVSREQIIDHLHWSARSRSPVAELGLAINGSPAGQQHQSFVDDAIELSSKNTDRRQGLRGRTLRLSFVEHQKRTGRPKPGLRTAEIHLPDGIAWLLGSAADAQGFEQIGL
jgi:hypothetical protein